MPCTIAGVPVLPPPGATTEEALRYWHGHRIEEWDHPGYWTRFLSHLPHPAAPQDDPPAVGRLHWPTGASSWGVMHQIATGAQVAAIEAAGTGPLAVALTDGVRTITTSMYVLPPRPIQTKSVPAANYHLLTLVDERWWWWQRGDQSAPLDWSTPLTWGDLFEALFAAVGVSATLDSIPGAYGNPSEIRWNVGFKPIPLLLDSAAAVVGMRIVRQLNGAVALQSAATAGDSDDASWALFQNERLSGGRQTLADVVRAVPASVGVVFWGFDPEVTTVTLASLALADYQGNTGVAGKVAQIVADAPATASGVHAAYAAQAAEDYYLWQLVQSDYTLRGFWNRTLNGNDHFQEWAHLENELVTRVVRRPISDDNVYGDKPPTVRFPATIESVYNAVTGYDWVRYTLDTDIPAYTVAVKTGNLLFERADRRDLVPGTKILMYSNPDGTGWEFEFPSVYRDQCEGGQLVRQVARDNGDTWETVEYLGVPCGGGGSGPGSGDPCAICFPDAGDGADVYVVVDVACVDGITYVIHARQAILWDNTRNRPVLSYYDFAYTTEGCCECAGGSGQTGSGGASGSGQTGGLCDVYEISGTLLLRTAAQRWADPGGLYGLEADWNDTAQSYDWELVGLVDGHKCIWRTPLGQTWDGAGCQTFTAANPQICPDVEVCCSALPTLVCADVPDTLTLTLSATGDCAGANGTVITLDRVPATNLWTLTSFAGGTCALTSATYNCDAGTAQIVFGADNTSDAAVGTVLSASPVQVNFTFSMSEPTPECCAGTITGVLTS